MINSQQEAENSQKTSGEGETFVRVVLVSSGLGEPVETLIKDWRSRLPNSWEVVAASMLAADDESQAEVIQTSGQAIEPSLLGRLPSETDDGILLVLDADRIDSLSDVLAVAQLARRQGACWGQAADDATGWRSALARRGERWLGRAVAGAAVKDPASPLIAYRLPVAGNQESWGLTPWNRVCLAAERALEGEGVAEVSVAFETTSGRAPRLSESPLGIAQGSKARGPFQLSWIEAITRTCRYGWRQRCCPATSQVQPSTSQPEPRSFWSWREAGQLLAVLAFAAVMLLWRLDYPLVEPDETRNSQIAIEMLASGDFVQPRHHGEPYWDKPPWLFWMTALSYRVLGPSNLAARLPCALAGLGTVAMLVLLGRGSFGARPTLFGAWLLLGSIGFVLSTRFIITDALLTFFVTTGWLCAYRAVSGPRLHPGWLLATGTALGLGILTKGPIAPVLVLPPVLAWSWLEGRMNMSWVLRSLPLWLPMVAIPLPWFVAVSWSDVAFLDHFFLKHHLMRYTQAFNHRQPFWYYVPVVFMGMFPASLLLPGLWVFVTSKRRSIRQWRRPEHGFLLLVAGWVVCFFSLSSSKLPTYILPSLPALSLLLGIFVDHLAYRWSTRPVVVEQPYLLHLSRWFPIQVVVMCAVLMTAAVIVESIMAGQIPINSLGLWATLAMVVLAGAMLTRRVDSMAGAAGFSMRLWWPGVVAIGSLSTGIFASVYVEGAAQRSYLQAAARELDQVAADEIRQRPVLWLGRLSDAVHQLPAPYDQGVTFCETQFDEAVEYCCDHPSTLVVTIPTHARAFAKELPRGLDLKRRRGSDMVFELVPEAVPSVRLSEREARQSSGKPTLE